MPTGAVHGLLGHSAHTEQFSGDRPVPDETECASLSKPACDVVFRPLVRWGGEYLFRLVELDQFAHEKECGELRHARRLLHVVGHDHDSVAFFQLEDQLFDLAGGNGIEGRAGSSISSTSGSTAMARAMQRRCCWPPERLAPDFFFIVSLTSSHNAESAASAPRFRRVACDRGSRSALSPAATLS